MDIRILGPLEAYDDGQRLALGGERQRALLAMLLLHRNEAVSSDRLIEALWGDHLPAEAAKTLQVAVSRLRKALAPGGSAGAESAIILTRAPGYELRLEDRQLDLNRFTALAEQGRAKLEAGQPGAAVERLGEALALWRGPPLADLAYQPFAQAAIGRLEEHRLTATEDRVAANLELGRHAEVIGELESLATTHPLRERIRAQLMLALYRSGRQAEALELYRDTRRVLVEELGIEPSRELKDLEGAILRQDPELDFVAAGGHPASQTRPASEALVGREQELDTLSALLDGALAGRGALALIGGEPGIGKSRLGEALVAKAEESGCRVLIGRCWEAGGAPAYWPWVQALRSYVRQSDPGELRVQLGPAAAELATIVPELRQLIPDLPDSPPSESEGGARFRLFESVASFLTSAASAAPLALVLDDLHAADAASLLLLRFVAGQLANTPALIVGCYRDTELVPGHPLAETLPELARNPAVRRMSLHGLSQRDTARLLELTTGEVPLDELAGRVHEETAGNPLFASEVARWLAAEGQLEHAGQGEARLPIPEGVKETIGRRLQRQSERCRHALTLASLLGREFDLDVLERVSGLQQEELFATLEEAIDARLVGNVPGSPGHLRFSHVLIRDTLYEELPATRRLRLHRTVADALENLHSRNPEPHLAELARHYLEAGSAVADKAIDYAARSGDRAASQLAYEEATRHYESALRLLETTGSGDQERACELLLSLGDVLSRSGRELEAKKAFRQAATVAESLGLPDRLARAALGYGGRFSWARAGSDSALVPLLERALAAIGEQDSPARVRLLARLGPAIRDEPLRDRRLRVGREALEMARRIGEPVTLAAALDGYYTSVEGPDNVGGRGAVADELISLAEQIGDKERAFMGHDYRLQLFWTLADRAGVEIELEALSGLSDELRQPPQQWHVAASQNSLALMEGGFEGAEALISETLALGERAQSWNAVVTSRLAMFVLRRAQGRLGELEDTLRRSVREYPALLRFQCALAHLYADLGRERDARALASELLSRDLVREHMDAEWFFSMILLSDVCAFVGDEDAAGRLYAWLLPHEHLYAAAPVEVSFGSVARGLGVLARTLSRLDDAERHFEAALDTERRMHARPWVAHAQHDFGAMLLDRAGPGDRERASELLDSAIGAYRELGMDSWAQRAAALG